MWTLYMETSSMITLKIMPRNLNELVRSWIRLQEKKTYMWRKYRAFWVYNTCSLFACPLHIFSLNACSFSVDTLQCSLVACSFYMRFLSARIIPAYLHVYICAPRKVVPCRWSLYTCSLFQGGPCTRVPCKLVQCSLHTVPCSQVPCTIYHVHLSLNIFALCTTTIIPCSFSFPTVQYTVYNV
jgi:hypothetical protein